MFGFIRNRGRRKAATLGVALGRDGVAVARIQPARRGGLPRLDLATYLPASDPRALARQLASCADEHGLGNQPTTGVLAADEYKVLQVDAPNVPASEISQAAAWRVKELIDFPLDQAVIDTFAPPETTQRAQQPVINVVVARKSLVAERINLLEDAGFGLEVIDIPDLVQRNISLHLPESRGGHALLAMGHKGGLLTVFRDGEQYMARSLDSGLADLESGDAETRDKLMLEIQRSFDYFESALSQAPVGALHIYPDVPVVNEFLERTFAETVNNVDGRALALADIVEVAEEPHTSEAVVLHAVGAALRGQEGPA